MALNFPIAPTNGQLFPDPSQPGVSQWIWDTSVGAWEKYIENIDGGIY